MTSPFYPITFTWTGTAMVPKHRFMRRCIQQFALDQDYVLEVHERRSHKSHSHYFATINDVFESLPESLAWRFPSAEHLRKYALCKTGFAEHRPVVARDAQSARDIAATMREDGPFNLIKIDEDDPRIVHRWKPMSQSVRAMNKQQFQESKTKVLEYLEDLVGVDRGSLVRRDRATEEEQSQ